MVFILYLETSENLDFLVVARNEMTKQPFAIIDFMLIVIEMVFVQ